MKLFHAYHIDPGGVPYAATIPFARVLVDAAPDRVVWGSDWPHPMRKPDIPNDDDLIDLLPAWAGSVPHVGGGSDVALAKTALAAADPALAVPDGREPRHSISHDVAGRSRASLPG